MKAVFICGSQESGKDGVGDYTRRLACQFIKEGNEATIVAVNDKYVINQWCGLQRDSGVTISVLRLPSTLSWKDRMRIVRDYITEYQPQWISLQFVIFTFHKKGLPFGLAKKIKGLNIVGAKWHIMFHEIWVGIKKDSPFSHFVYKPFQQMIIKRLNKVVEPSCIHTTNIVYQLELKRKSIYSTILSLFDNVPFCSISFEAKNNLLATLQLDKKSEKSHKLVAVFGNIHQFIEVIEAIKNLCDQTKRNNQIPYIFFFGRMGISTELIKESLSDKDIQTHFFGEVSEEEASHLLQIADIAVSCTPEEFIGKSSIYSTFKAYGLPVKQTYHINILQYKHQIESFNNYLEQKPAHEWQVSFVVKQFINDLRLHSNL